MTCWAEVESLARQPRLPVRQDRPRRARRRTLLAGWCSTRWSGGAGCFSHDQIQFQNTACSDLTLGEAALLAQMKNKWRYNMRLAEKRGVRVRQGSEADLATFYALYADTGMRDGFLIRPYPYYLATWQTFLRAEAEGDNPAGGVLLLAEHPEDSVPVGRRLPAALCEPSLVFLWRQQRAPSPGYAQSPAPVGSHALGAGPGLHRLRLVGRAYTPG